ncbi:MAG: elongation factor G [Ignavibacteriales bacterium]|nr:elongation factor G [Ignavibacteriales bacterium]
MKEYNAEAIRNIALVGHGGSGKTTISEILLFTGGEINRIGKVEEGNTTSDFNSNEIEKRISIAASPLHVEWNNIKINILDTPGFPDFIGQVISSLHVADVAISVIKSFEGVEVGTEQTWEVVKKNKLPAAVIINKCDNEHSKFFETIAQAKTRLSHDITVVSFPVKEGLNFNSVIDLVKMKMITYGDAGSKKITEEEIPAELKAHADKLREVLVEKIAESNEELMNKFFEEGNLSDDEIQKGLKISIISGGLIPAFAFAGSKGIGQNTFLEYVVKYFPAPNEREPLEVTMKEGGKKVKLACDVKGEPALLIFKSLSEQHVGELSIFKVYSGSLVPGMDLQNTHRDKIERLGQIYVLNGHNRKDIAKLNAGDIGAVVKLKDSHTGDTLCSKNFTIILPEIEYPEPVIRFAVKPKAKGDEDKISAALHTAHEEEPTLRTKFDGEISQTIVSGQGELQLNLGIKLLKDRYAVDVELVEPRIPYRETVKGKCEDSEYKHKKQSGGRGQYGHVHLKIEPLPRGTGYEFVDAIVGGVVPGRFIPAVEKGLKEIMAKGILTGSKVVDVRVTLFDGTYHAVDSDEVSFKIAASQAFKKGFLEARPMLLEPIYDINVKIPEKYMGDVMGDISGRRGKIQNMDSDNSFQIIKAKVPLAELHKYSTQLRSLTSGRGMFAMSFSHYEEVPKETEGKVIEDYQKHKEEEAE